jgi:cation diffusion facilitator CzcD-associated flavoprotein CzcO
VAAASGDDAPEHLDVLIVGAGLSGVGAGHQMHAIFPRKTYAILEARHEIGGTWSLFTYPGVRSDSDMHTLGYRFRPWLEEKAIADGPSILEYVRATARDGDVERHIRFGRRAVSAAWSTEHSRWTVEVEDVETGESSRLTCGFLFMCSGYYRYDEGYTPEFEGVADFAGTVVHPQHWPDDLDYTGKRVVVVGSGATAVTLVPAMAGDAEHVTMLQRSPTYIVALPEKDRLAISLHKFLPAKLVYSIIRWKNVLRVMASYQLSRRRPEAMKKLLRSMLEKQLPADFDIDTHFTPPYNPWDQRLCVVPDGDLFRALRRGSASIVTDRIDRFTPTGLKLVSGAELDADIIVTATGLNLLVFGGIELSVDGEPVHIPDHMTYKGIMLNDVPNFVFGIGYTNASWTLKIDLTYDYVWRLLEHMDRTGTTWCAPRLRDPSITARPFLDFSAGYVLRSVDRFPKTGSKAPWSLRMNYLVDRLAFARGSVDDGVMEFGSGAMSSGPLLRTELTALDTA